VANDTTPRTCIVLHHSQADGQVLVQTSDEDRFMVTVDAAIRACRLYDKMTEFRSQFKRLIDKLREWVEARKDQIREALVTPYERGLLFLVVRRASEYDRDFEDELTELDLAVAHDEELGLIRLSVLGLPNASPEAIDSFLAPRDA
jgi:hypothetical protein